MAEVILEEELGTCGNGRCERSSVPGDRSSFSLIRDGGEVGAKVPHVLSDVEIRSDWTMH